jgi:GTPase SAR1 family protein
MYADESVVIALVGNKCDLTSLAPHRRQVKFEEAQKFANENNLLFIGESSAQNNIIVKEVMQNLFEGRLRPYNS